MTLPASWLTAFVRQAYDQGKTRAAIAAQLGTSLHSTDQIWHGDRPMRGSNIAKITATFMQGR